MTQVRFHVRHARLGAYLYMRGDGTTTFFFSRDALTSFLTSAGFRVDRCDYGPRLHFVSLSFLLSDASLSLADCRKLLNRKRKLTMYRVWIQCVATKPL